MYNSVPRYQIRAYVEKKRKKEELEKKAPIAPFKPNIHLKRVSGEALVTEYASLKNEVIPLRMLLNDISPLGTTLFAKSSVLAGQKISLTLEGPKRIFVQALVTECHRISHHTTIRSSDTYPFRMKVRFIFTNEIEKQSIKKYCERDLFNFLYRDWAKTPTPAKEN